MFERISRFFRNLFQSGSDSDAIVEDASDLMDPVVVKTFEPDAPLVRSRGLNAPEAASLNLDEITITQPKFVWCLDNGHGSEQNGKRSPFWKNEAGENVRFEEWEFNRDIVKRIMTLMDEKGLQYFNVVPEDNVGSFLRERVARANQFQSPLGLPKIYLSIHANAASVSSWNNAAHGLETWYYPNSKTGIRLASAFQQAMVNFLPTFKDRGIRSHQSGSSKIFYVLRKTGMPAVLTENGFYTHEEETRNLMKDEVRQKIAEAHFAAIVRIEQQGIEQIPTYRPNMIIG